MNSILTSTINEFIRLSKYHDGFTVTYRDSGIDLENSKFKITKINNNNNVTVSPTINIKSTDSIKLSCKNISSGITIQIQLESM